MNDDCYLSVTINQYFDLERNIDLKDRGLDYENYSRVYKLKKISREERVYEPVY